MARVGRDISGNFPLRRTPMCSGSPDNNVIDSATADEIRALYQEAEHEIAGPVQYLKFVSGVITGPYQESTAKTFAAPITIPAIININPSLKEVTDMGVREQVDALLTFSYNDLQAVNVTITTDDHFTVDGKTYMVYQVNPENYIGAIPMTITVVCKVYSEEAPVQIP